MGKSEILEIIIPTYNEKDNISNLLFEIAESLKESNVSLILTVIDDNSPDKTFEVVNSIKANIESKYPYVKIVLIKRAGKLGLGTAYITGFKKALEDNADYIMEMDADFSHQPKYLPLFLDAAKDNDVVIGSRYIKGGGVVDWGFIRRFISLGGSIYSKTILGMNIQDMTGGFNIFSNKVLKAIPLEDVKSNGYSFQLEMKYRSFKKGFKLKEIPIIFPDRKIGKSKMSKRIFLEAIKMVWKIKLDKSIN